MTATTPVKTAKPQIIQELENALSTIQGMGIFDYQRAQTAADSAISTGSACRSEIDCYCKGDEWIAEYFLSELDYIDDLWPNEGEDESIGVEWFAIGKKLQSDIVKTGYMKRKALLEFQIQAIDKELAAFETQ